MSKPPYSASFALLLILFVGKAAVAQSPGVLTDTDTVTFTNGDRLSGKLIQAAGDSVTFEGKVTKTLTLDWRDIQQLDLANGTSVFRKNASVNKLMKANVTVIRVEGPNLVLDPAAATSQTIPIDELASMGKPEPPTPAPASSSWDGQLSSNDSFLISTQHQYQVGGTVSLGRETTSDQALVHQADNLHLQAAFGESQKPKASPVITRLYEGSFQHDFYLTDTRYNDDGSQRYWGPRAFVLADLYDNFSLGMKLEQAYAGGVAWNGEDGPQRFTAGADLRYIGEDLYATTKRLNLVASSFDENYSVHFPLATKLAIFAENVWVIPAYNDPHALQARGIASLTLPLTKRLSIGPVLSDDYLRNAPPKSKQNFLSLTFSLSYKLGASVAP